jgi:hypothetical protein
VRSGLPARRLPVLCSGCFAPHEMEVRVISWSRERIDRPQRRRAMMFSTCRFRGSLEGRRTGRAEQCGRAHTWITELASESAAAAMLAARKLWLMLQTWLDGETNVSRQPHHRHCPAGAGRNERQARRRRSSCAPHSGRLQWLSGLGERSYREPCCRTILRERWRPVESLLKAHHILSHQGGRAIDKRASKRRPHPA